MPNKEYFKSTPGVAKTINLGIGCGLIILSRITRPTELQEEIVESTWKEYALFALSIAGVVFSSISLALFLIMSKNHWAAIRIIDGVLHFYAAICFLISGLLFLQATVWIFLAIGECCRQHHNDQTVSCKLPGFGNGTATSLPLAEGPFVLKELDAQFLIPPPVVPNLPKCANDISHDYWQCNLCINREVQPHFAWKGATGALAILNAVFYAIIGGVALKLIRETFRIC